MTEAGPLIRTRILPPRVGTATLPRKQIVTKLSDSKDDKLIVVLGPLGAGKSTLLNLYRKELISVGRRVAWYNHSEDDDEAQFLAYLTICLEEIGVSITSKPVGLYALSGRASSEAFLAAMIEAMADMPEPIHLMMDDFHAVNSPEIVAFTQKLLKFSPENFQLIISSRAHLPFDLLALRVKGQVTEMSFSELRFTFEESVSFFRAQRVDGLSGQQLRSLHNFTDGWAAGLQISALSLKRMSDPGSFLKKTDNRLPLGGDADIHNYLTEFIKEHLTKAELNFLVAVSAFQRFSRELCEKVLGKQDFASMLLQLEKENLFIIPIESHDDIQWYRFHRLFGSYLQGELANHPQDDLRKLNLRASQWFAEKGFHIEAIHHADLAGDRKNFFNLVEHGSTSLLRGAHFTQLLKWFDDIPREFAKDSYGLLRSVAWSQLMCGRMADFEWTVESMQAHPNSAKLDGSFELLLLKSLSLIRSDDTESVVRILKPLLPKASEARPFSRMLLHTLLGLALLHSNRFEEVRRIVKESEQTYSYSEWMLPRPYLDSLIGISLLKRGRFGHAKKELTAVLAQSTQHANLGADAAAYLACHLSEALYQIDELEEAEFLLSRYAELIEAVGLPSSILSGFRTRVRLLAARGNSEKVEVLLDRMEHFGRMSKLDRLTAWSLSLRIHNSLNNSDFGSVRENLLLLEDLATKHQDSRKCAFAEIPILFAVAKSEVSISRGRYNAGLQILEPLIASYDEKGMHYDATTLRLRATYALKKQGNNKQAMHILRQAVVKATECGMPRVLVDEGRGLEELLHTLLSDSELPTAERSQIEAALKKRVPFKENRKDNTQTELLTPRERDVLELLANAYSNKSIANVLNVSAGTVKWHLKNIYTKLDAVSREDAVKKGRSFGLIR